MDRADLLIKEYEIIGSQIEHWDNHFWNKSNFFLVVESALLAVVTNQLNDELRDNKPFQQAIFYLSILIVIFNLFLCYVWFRTNRTNHEYQMVRFLRALQIEKDPVFFHLVELYHFQRSMLMNPKYVKHSSSWWEINIPIAFMLAWIGSLILVAYISKNNNYIITTIFIIFVILACIFVEKTGWPKYKREKVG